MNYHFNTSLGNLTHQISKGLGARLMQHLAQAGLNATPEQWCVISMLHATKLSTQTEVGEFLGYDKVRVARLLERLEHDKLIIRQINPLDKRVKMIALTPRGNRLYKLVEPFAEKTLEEALGGFSAVDLKQLMHLLRSINQNLENSPWNLQNK